MDDELKKKVDATWKLTEENNKLLGKIYRSHKLDRFYRFLHFLLTIVVLAISYYYIEPYIAQVRTLYKQASSAYESGNAQYENLKNLYQPK